MKRSHLSLFWSAALALLLAGSAGAAEGPARYLKQPDAWFSSDEGKRVTANILSYQSPLGSWPKNLDTTEKPYMGDPTALRGTFDNGATTDELRFLARAFRVTHVPEEEAAFTKGLAHIFQAQYPTGGWPQSYPPDRTYHRYITFNDDAMVRLMRFLHEVATADEYAFVPAERRHAAQSAFDRGITCILKCQVRVNGKRTVWCAQHDEKDYSPRPGRTYELTSLSGSESVGITRLLMSLEHPSAEVAEAVEGAVAWFQAVKLPSIRVVQRPDANSPKGFNREVVQDPAAPPMWARFYEIGANRPIFADRDGVAKRSLAEIGYERRNGYSWLGYWPAALLEQEYPKWKAAQR